jgi:ELWxxDGT repeat protein
MVKDLVPGPEEASLGNLTAAGDLLYLTGAVSADVGKELLRSDGTEAGTYLVKDILAGPPSSDPQDLVAHGGVLYFNSRDQESGREPWVSDGTSVGTRMLSDVRPGKSSSNPTALIPVSADRLVFGAHDGILGRELWETDGTESGTRLAQDINTGLRSSTPTGFVRSGGLLYFAAYDDDHGVELWALPSNQPPRADAGSDAEWECTSQSGALVRLDGSDSSDLDSSSGTNDDIVLFEWFEDLGLLSETSLGTGQSLDVSMSLGSHVITLQVTDSFGETDTDDVVITVSDSAPPEVTSIDAAPTILWPPNHRMVQVEASMIATDNCGSPIVLLTSITSNEPYNAVANGDGDTINDIQAADLGTPDFEFSLRAERSGSGDGRTYTVTYIAVDSAGNESSAQAMVEVPHDQGGVTDPLGLLVEEKGSGTVVEWIKVPGAQSYNVIRGLLSDIRNLEPAYDLGAVTCIEAGSGNETTAGNEDPDQPNLGEVFFYLVEYDDGLHSSYGTESAAKPRLARSGDCE